MKRATVIRHLAFEDLGTLAATLHSQGYGVNYIEAGQDDLATLDPNEPDLLVVLGGPIGAYDEQDYPFLLDEFRIIEHRLNNEKPILGICLGAQIMARVLGAKVYPGPEKEIGWSPIQLSESGQQSPLSYLDSTPVLHWHGDTFDLPVGAVHLASSSKYVNQAFAWKKCALGLQFHPEVTARGLERWFIGHAGEINATPGISVAQLRSDTAKYAQALEEKSSKLWYYWLQQL